MIDHKHIVAHVVKKGLVGDDRSCKEALQGMTEEMMVK